jgi:hypothetical protein
MENRSGMTGIPLCVRLGPLSPLSVFLSSFLSIRNRLLLSGSFCFLISQSKLITLVARVNEVKVDSKEGTAGAGQVSYTSVACGLFGVFTTFPPAHCVEGKKEDSHKIER